MLDHLIGDEERFSEILVLVMTQGIEFDAWVCLTSDGISLEGRRLVAVPRDGHRSDEHVDRQRNEE